MSEKIVFVLVPDKPTYFHTADSVLHGLYHHCLHGVWMDKDTKKWFDKTPPEDVDIICMDCIGNSAYKDNIMSGNFSIHEQSFKNLTRALVEMEFEKRKN